MCVATTAERRGRRLGSRRATAAFISGGRGAVGVGDVEAEINRRRRDGDLNGDMGQRDGRALAASRVDLKRNPISSHELMLDSIGGEEYCVTWIDYT